MPITSPNMGLRIWNNLDDPYDHDQLADNWAKVDFHDHSPGRGHQIPTEGFADGAITSSKLATAATIKGVGSFSANRTAALATVAAGTEIIFDTEEWDFSGWYDVGNGRFTPQVAGYYRVNALGSVSTDLAANGFYELGFTKNGTIVKYTSRVVQPAASPSTTSFRVAGSALILCNGTTDYISVKTDSSAAIDFVVGAAHTYFQGELVGRS